MSSDIAVRFYRAVVESLHMPDAAARVGAWMIGVALDTGGFPLELSTRQIKDGFVHGNLYITGTGSHLEIIKEALEWLERYGHLQSVDGGHCLDGHACRIYNME